MLCAGFDSFQICTLYEGKAKQRLHTSGYTPGIDLARDDTLGLDRNSLMLVSWEIQIACPMSCLFEAYNSQDIPVSLNPILLISHNRTINQNTHTHTHKAKCPSTNSPASSSSKSLAT